MQKGVHKRSSQYRDTKYHLQYTGDMKALKGEVHPKMKVSYMVVFGALSRMVKVRGACYKPFWVYKRLNKLRRPAPEIDDVLVVEEPAVTPHGDASSSHWRAARALAPVCVSHHTYRWSA